MRRIVIDIETCAYPFESLAESQREYLLRYAEKEPDPEKRQMMVDDAVRYTSLYPYTAKCIAIGIFDVEKEKSYIYYESNKDELWKSEDENIHYKGLLEIDMLKSFWRVANAADQIITFNGRNFDIPFLMMRSAMLKIKVTKNLMSYRYGDEHIDLLEKFTFYGATRKFNLDFYCNAFGIESSKTSEVSGMEVKNLYEAGRIKDIAVYCSRDIYATYKLFKIWNEYLNLK
ncbi:MAG: ribonuclease H-like domain-containing protein [Ignavibacteria bacterium]|nr:ribonuclease H-like domain-containing protein [Ignavibacteria bacterium]MBT8382474.1 ribonuclease H-like domain-containing protein [Ignavibacteria bacterium]MBT8391819.1 ribonuclease H-like domain-containing protein [Ignavibacteria bacterium]NNJ51880.1 3'-5' exonuclease [Ignavibacteriaceae bacterium]NNL21088.1 3'-5' exonuclease [Ignavibacteriaceae bacterium]